MLTPLQLWQNATRRRPSAWPLGLLQVGERTFQLLQGKGLGSHSLRSEVRAASRFLKPGAVVFDVGANRGMYTKELLRRHSNLIEQIHLFEPSKAHYAQLKTIADPRVVVNCVGLGAKKDTRQLYSDSIGSGLSSLYKRNLAHKGISMSHSEEVKISTVDDYVQANNIERIALLKLDVEGHELSVLQGARESLPSRVLTVQFEFGGCNLDSRNVLQRQITLRSVNQNAIPL
jgi:FkbM family methyltransferase